MFSSRGHAAAAGAPTVPTAVVDHVDIQIPKETEVCITVPVGEVGAFVSIVPPRRSADSPLEPSDAEVCGAPLVDGIAYALRDGTSFAVWSWLGCTLRLRGPAQWRATCAYRPPSTHYKGVAEYHTQVHKYREAAAQRDRGIGPRVVVCGTAASGRHSVARTLANLAVRQPAGWAPTFVDLDPRHPTVGPPGCISVTAWEYCATLDEDTTHLASSLFWVGSTITTAGGSSLEAATTAFAPASPVLNLVSSSALRLAMKRLTAHAGSTIGWSGAVVVAPVIPDPQEAARCVAGIASSIDATHVLCVGDDELAVAIARRLELTLGSSGSLTPGTYVTAHGTSLQLDSISGASGAMDWSLPALEGPFKLTRLRTFFNGLPHISLVPLREEIPYANLDVVRWAESDGQPTVQRVPETQYVALCDKRIGALYRSSDTIQSAPMLYPCHVVSVDGSSLVVRVCGVLPKQEKLTLAVGSINWLA